MKDVESIVHSHSTKKEAPSYGPVSQRVVEYGIARLREDFMGEIDEPLALFSLLRWFETQEGFQLANGLKQRLGDQEQRGLAFEELVILYITKIFRNPVRLDQVFEFHSSPPTWASEPAQLVHRVGTNKFEPVDLDSQSPHTPATGVTCYAEKAKDVICWLTESRLGWCCPSNSFGPDLLMWLRFSSGEVRLVMIQNKSYFSGNVDSLKANVVADALDSLTPGHWFKSLVSTCSLMLPTPHLHISSHPLHVIH